jgi:hypothetical protein
LFYSYFRHFFSRAILCVLFKVKCIKKSGDVTHIWITGGSDESNIFIKFIKSCCFHNLCGPICPPPQGLRKRCCRTFCVADSFTDVPEQFWRHMQNPHSHVIIPISDQLSWAEKSPFKAAKMIQDSAGLCHRKASREPFLCLQTVVAQLRIGLEN